MGYKYKSVPDGHEYCLATDRFVDVWWARVEQWQLLRRLGFVRHVGVWSSGRLTVGRVLFSSVFPDKNDCACFKVILCLPWYVVDENGIYRSQTELLLRGTSNRGGFSANELSDAIAQLRADFDLANANYLKKFGW